MAQNGRIYMTTKEMAELLGVSVGQAYKMIRQMNTELAQQGYLVIARKVPRRYFETRWYGYGA